GQMPCNPAIGGIAKGQLVREIDALGGAMGENTDATSIQFRMLNLTKGPAVWSPRAQCDKNLYQLRMKSILENQENLHIRQMEARDLMVDDGVVCGIINEFGEEIRAKAVVISTGTFLRGLLHYGERSFEGGRAGDIAANFLSTSLKEKVGLKLGRLKTGTPARILGKSIDFSKLEYQESDSDYGFSFFKEAKTSIGFEREKKIAQLPCYIGRTSVETRDVVQKNLHLAPMYSGKLEGVGARYCPSFEDKVVRFAHHETHQLFIEPEGIHTQEYYVNGISTSLPPEVQWQMIRSINGFENAVMSRYAYAVEYDFVYPNQLDATLSVKSCPTLFCAGQVNGTSGYEEAAGQGLIAGINAARKVLQLEPFIVQRSEGYIGVMIDDLITKDISEPYRLFTSRSEYRLSLRQDNADIRLTPRGRQAGLVSDERWASFQEYCQIIASEKSRLESERTGGKSLWEWLKQHADYSQLSSQNEELPKRVREHLEIEAKYEGYIKRERELIVNMSQLESWEIPLDYDYQQVKGLKNETREKLLKFRPSTLAQASRIDGMTPAEIALLQVHLRRK
ncbi:MAG: tRNA uridine-5-carboxymethylaminomethyl(34) synthesis enzyme MnmG, partial [Lentisphaeria bacterium]